MVKWIQRFFEPTKETAKSFEITDTIKEEKTMISKVGNYKLYRRNNEVILATPKSFKLFDRWPKVLEKLEPGRYLVKDPSILHLNAIKEIMEHCANIDIKNVEHKQLTDKYFATIERDGHDGTCQPWDQTTDPERLKDFAGNEERAALMAQIRVVEASNRALALAAVSAGDPLT